MAHNSYLSNKGYNDNHIGIIKIHLTHSIKLWKKKCVTVRGTFDKFNFSDIQEEHLI